MTGARRSSAQTSRLYSVISRIGEVATTEAVRKPPIATSGGGPVRRSDEYGNFAYDITSPDRSHRLTIDDDIGSTALDGVQRIPCVSLGSECLPGRDFLLRRHARDGGKLVFGQAGEEADRRQPQRLHFSQITQRVLPTRRARAPTIPAVPLDIDTDGI